MFPRIPSLLLVLAGTGALLAAEEPPRPPGKGPDPTRLLGEALERDWKGRPEWAELAVAILKGGDLGPGTAWWRPSGRLRGWKWLAERFDADGDGRIARTELPAEDLLFERLDADGDGAIAAKDLEAPEPSSPGPASPAGEVFHQLDRDSNGKVTREELDAFFRRHDQGGLGFLTREDLERAFPAPEGDGGEGGMPPPLAMLSMLFTGQLGSLGEGARAGAEAPDFELPTHDGKSRVRLSGSRGKRPVVLIFGSFT